MRIKIETNFLRAALQAASKEETRYYLNGVFVKEADLGDA